MKLFLTRLFSIFLVNWTDNYDITFRRDVDKVWLYSRFSILSSLSLLCNSVRNSVFILFSSRKKYATLRTQFCSKNDFNEPLESWFCLFLFLLLLLLLLLLFLLFYFTFQFFGFKFKIQETLLACSPITHHVIFSGELFFYPSKHYSFVYEGNDFLKIWKQQFSRVSSNALKWGNKTYKLNWSIAMKIMENEKMSICWKTDRRRKLWLSIPKKLKWKFLICIFFSK